MSSVLLKHLNRSYAFVLLGIELRSSNHIRREDALMKNLKLRVTLLFVGTVLTLGLSHQVAQAAGCPNIVVGGTVSGEYDCRQSAITSTHLGYYTEHRYRR